MQNVEKRIITALIEACELAGFVPVKFWDSGEYQDVTWKANSVGPTAEQQRIESSITCVDSVDEGTLHFAPKSDLGAWGQRGVLLILGNGIDIISDWHCGDSAFDHAVESVAMRSEDFS